MAQTRGLMVNFSDRIWQESPVGHDMKDLEASTCLKMPSPAFRESLDLQGLSRKKPRSVKASGGGDSYLPRGQPRTVQQPLTSPQAVHFLIDGTKGSLW